MLLCTPSQFFQVKVDAQGSPRSRRSVPETTTFFCGGGRRQATPRCNSRCNTPHGSNLPNSGSSGPPSGSNASREPFWCQDAPNRGANSARKERKRQNRSSSGHMLLCTPSQFFQWKVDPQVSPRGRFSVPELATNVDGVRRRQAKSHCNG